MKKNHFKKYFFIFVISFFISASFSYWIFIRQSEKNHESNNSEIVLFDYNKHADRVDELLNDNWYWMMEGFDKQTYQFKKKLEKKVVSFDGEDKDKPMDVYVAIHNNYPVGFVSFYNMAPSIGRICLLAIDKSSRRLKLGETLVLEALDKLFKQNNNDRVVLLVRNNNVKAQNLYKKIGFFIIKEEPLMSFYAITKEIFLQNFPDYKSQIK